MKKHIMKKILIFLFIIPISSLVLVGCHKMQGAGTDIKGAGKSLEESASPASPPSYAPPCVMLDESSGHYEQKPGGHEKKLH
jgi:predicted small secreted protein